MDTGDVKLKRLGLPRLNRLTPTLESTALKLMEEAGELGALIGKYRALSGERMEIDPDKLTYDIGRELLDVAQTAITMMFVLEEEYGVDLDRVLAGHIRKLIEKGYLEVEGAELWTRSEDKG